MVILFVYAALLIIHLQIQISNEPLKNLASDLINNQTIAIELKKQTDFLEAVLFSKEKLYYTINKLRL